MSSLNILPYNELFEITSLEALEALEAIQFDTLSIKEFLAMLHITTKEYLELLEEYKNL